MSPAEILTAAADKLEDLLHALPSRWPDSPWQVEACADVEMVECLCIVSQGEHAPFDEPQIPPIQYIADGETPAHAAYIAVMQPVVGRALVALLRHSAARVRINPDALIDMELILARTILGEAAS